MISGEEKEPDFSAIRKELANSAKSKRCRKYPIRNRWTPWEVISPISGLPFSDAGAWSLIIEKLEAGEEIQEEPLTGEKAKMAYEMIFDIEPLKPLYIKIHFYNGQIWGKSFHYCEK